ncbi:MAG: hypothetical protein J6V51_03775 [Bacteroidales bacterium]|nr:hypothetical protein [Bacteroidales bacterium]
MKIEGITIGISEWLENVIASALPKVSISPNGTIGKVMNGFFGIDLSTYNVWKELGFLAQPMIQNFVSPALSKYLAMIPEEKLEEAVMSLVDAMIDQAEKNGYVNVFGIQLGKNAFQGLKDILEKKV